MNCWYLHRTKNVVYVRTICSCGCESICACFEVLLAAPEIKPVRVSLRTVEASWRLEVQDVQALALEDELDEELAKDVAKAETRSFICIAVSSPLDQPNWMRTHSHSNTNWLERWLSCTEMYIRAYITAHVHTHTRTQAALTWCTKW